MESSQLYVATTRLMENGEVPWATSGGRWGDLRDCGYAALCQQMLIPVIPVIPPNSGSSTGHSQDQVTGHSPDHATDHATDHQPRTPTATCDDGPCPLESCLER